MSIASRIEAIEQHLTDDYSVLEVAGADLTNVDKNIINLKPTWQERLLYFINNGTDVVWNNWEKVEGTGESLSLNSTEEAPMKINLKGNTSQETTTQSKNLMPNEAESQTINGLTITKGTDGSLLINGTSNATTKIALGTTNLASGTYTLSTHKEGTTTDSCYLRTVDTTTESEISGTSFNIYSSNSKTYTLSENKKVKFDFYTGGNRTFTNFKIYPMAESGSTATDYVEFVPNSPSPDYPQDIHVVSGNNSINVCNKNLYGTAIKTDNITGSSYTIITDTSDKLEIQGISSFYSGIYKKYQLQPNTQYTISSKYSQLGSKSRARIYYKLGNDCENITVNDNN